MENGEAPLRVLVLADERATRRRIVRLLGDVPGVVVVDHPPNATGALPCAHAADAVLVDATPAAASEAGVDAPERFVVHDGRRRHLVAPVDILWVASYGNYARIVTVTGRHYLHRATITETARRLAPHGFVRVHRTTVVNAARVVRLRPSGNGQDEARLDTGHRIRVSRSYRTALREHLAAFAGTDTIAAAGARAAAMPPVWAPAATPTRRLSAPRAAGRQDSRTSARTVPSR